MIIILAPFINDHLKKGQMDARNDHYFNTIFKHHHMMYLWNVPLICIIYTYVRAKKELQKWKCGVLINDVNVQCAKNRSLQLITILRDDVVALIIAVTVVISLWSCSTSVIKRLVGIIVPILVDTTTKFAKFRTSFVNILFRRVVTVVTTPQRKP